MATNILAGFLLANSTLSGLLSSCSRNKHGFPLICGKKHALEFARRMGPCRFATSSQRFQMLRTDDRSTSQGFGGVNSQITCDGIDMYLFL